MALDLASVRIRLRLAVRKGLALVRRVIQNFVTGSDNRLLHPTFVDHATNNRIILAAAEARGIDVKQLPSEVLMLEHEGRRAFSQGSGFQFESMVTHLICADKELTLQVLKMSGLPIPKFGTFNLSTYGDAVAFVRKLPGSAVVKPCRGTWGGVGITVGVDTEPELETAFLDALMHCRDVIIEEYIPGTCYRFLVLDDKVITVKEMSHASVVGDGKSTVSDLVRIQNANLVDALTLEGQQKEIIIDREAKRMLRKQDVTLDHVPRKGERVQLKGTANSNMGGSRSFVTSSAHAELNDLAVRATAAVKARLCGVDIIARDVSAPLAKAGVYLNEVNTTPGLYGIDASIFDGILDLLVEPYESVRDAASPTE